MKNLISVLLIFAVLVSLTGCGEIKKAEKTVIGLFEALKETNIEKVSEYMNVDDLKVEGNDENSIISNTVIIQNMFKQFDYKIISSEKKDDSTVVVTAEITNTDMKPVLSEFFTKAMQYAFSNAFSDSQDAEEESDTKIDEMFIESLNKPDLATVTNTVYITVIKTEDKSWKVKSDDAFRNALLGGLYEAVKDIFNGD